jgi:hypothetical protein
VRAKIGEGAEHRGRPPGRDVGDALDEAGPDLGAHEHAQPHREACRRQRPKGQVETVDGVRQLG